MTRSRKKLILSANHGMSERTDVTTGGDKLTPIYAGQALSGHTSDSQNIQPDEENPSS